MLNKKNYSSGKVKLINILKKCDLYDTIYEINNDNNILINELSSNTQENTLKLTENVLDNILKNKNTY